MLAETVTPCNATVRWSAHYKEHKRWLKLTGYDEGAQFINAAGKKAM